LLSKPVSPKEQDAKVGNDLPNAPSSLTLKITKGSQRPKFFTRYNLYFP